MGYKMVNAGLYRSSTKFYLDVPHLYAPLLHIFYLREIQIFSCCSVKRAPFTTTFSMRHFVLHSPALHPFHWFMGSCLGKQDPGVHISHIVLVAISWCGGGKAGQYKRWVNTGDILAILYIAMASQPRSILA